MAPRRPQRRAIRTAVDPALPTPDQSTETTPVSSAFPSAYPSEAENESDAEEGILSAPMTPPATGAVVPQTPPKKRRISEKPFRFLDLPSELRVEIYALHFEGIDKVVDLDSDNYKRVHKKLAIFRTCRTIYHEASHVFYSTHTFRIFPTQPGRFFKTKKPLLARLNTNQRRSITSLELRLGPGWNRPPRGWVVNPALGLSECVNVRQLTVFVECDPSDSVFKGFRKADGFYETFSRNLLDDVLAEMPFLDRVHFDAWSSVKKTGAMMTGLLEVARARGRKICWGPERGWSEEEEEDEGGQRDEHEQTMAQLQAAMAFLGTT
ncbi:uncharacterized protein P884DRAFT_230965 [Thermothelomyces heterothallicus CBS 202.75]|uniref:uncharacterized protein n=1 Tax=Thermothelomyces heterothallicus CBS 202.75 TaxID=1149848 RepID=UPI0037425C08